MNILKISQDQAMIRLRSIQYFSTLIIAIIFPSIFLSCNSELDNIDGDSDMEPGYEIKITNGSGGTQTFSGVETDWDIDTGIVVLGPEDEGEPLARLQITLKKAGESVEISDAILSTQNLRVITNPAEGDARLYELAGSSILLFDIIEMNSAKVISDGSHTIDMDRVQVYSTDPAEEIKVEFKFHATD